MNGWCKFVSENQTSLVINYSLESNQNCDGTLLFDKSTKDLVIVNLARNATEELTKNFICSVRGRIRRGFEMNKIYYLAIG